MKHAHLSLIVFVGLCVLILGAMARLTFEVAWDTHEEVLAAKSVAAETRDRIDWAKRRLDLIDARIDRSMTLATLYDKGRQQSADAQLERLLEIWKNTDAVRFNQIQQHEEVMKRLGDQPR